MSFIGEYRKQNGRYELYKGDEKSGVSIRFYPHCSVAREIREGDKLEIRMHRDIRRDDTVLYGGILVYDNESWWIQGCQRENLDHTGSVREEYQVGDDGIDDIPNPSIGEYIECRLHRLERSTNV